jgi:NAD(P)-dependent dehydrogenase (short-subunit alcohol dehydrogenase family)
MAVELSEYRIRVNANPPGRFVTNIDNGRLKDPVVHAAWDMKAQRRRMAEPHQIKPLALYPASDASSNLTGSQIVIDDGSVVGRRHRFEQLASGGQVREFSACAFFMEL